MKNQATAKAAFGQLHDRYESVLAGQTNHWPLNYPGPKRGEAHRGERVDLEIRDASWSRFVDLARKF